MTPCFPTTSTSAKYDPFTLMDSTKSWVSSTFYCIQMDTELVKK